MKEHIKSDPEKIQITLLLEGEEVARFLRYKEKQRLKAHATAGYKLLMERLEQVEAEAVAAA